MRARPAVVLGALASLAAIAGCLGSTEPAAPGIDPTVDGAAPPRGDAQGDGGTANESGACGECSTGLCVGGSCHPVTTLAVSGYSATRKIVLVNETLFFIDMLETSGGFSSTVRAVHKDGTAVPIASPPVGGGFDVLADFATDGATLFVSLVGQNVSGGPPGLYRCVGGSCTTLATTARAASLAVQGDHVYWADTSSGDLYRCAKTGCADTPELVATAPAGAAGANGTLVATDDTRLYVAYPTGLIGAAPLGVGGTVTTLAMVSGDSSSLTVDDANVYASDSAGNVVRCAKSGCPGGATVVATTAKARSLSTDGTTLFWLAEPRGTVWSAPVSGGAATAVIAVPDGFERHDEPARALAVDSTTLYFGGQGVFSTPR